MITLLIIVMWIAIAAIYALQFQIVRDYHPVRFLGEWWCIVRRYSIFDMKSVVNNMQ